MKKFLLLMVMSFALILSTFNQAEAQSSEAAHFTVIAGDSLATADTVFKKIPITAGYTSMGVQVAIKKGTGTLDGKLYLWSSVNGSNYVLTDSASFTAVPTHATLISNGGYTHTAIINKASPSGTRFIAFVTQTGSLTASPTKFSFTARK
jgi:hypothetical protein